MPGFFEPLLMAYSMLSLIHIYNVGSNLLEINETFDCADGDYFFLVVNQEDGEQIVSAPMWLSLIHI